MLEQEQPRPVRHEPGLPWDELGNCSEDALSDDELPLYEDAALEASRLQRELERLHCLLPWEGTPRRPAA